MEKRTSSPNNSQVCNGPHGFLISRPSNTENQRWEVTSSKILAVFYPWLARLLVVRKKIKK
jgi:hypothetical protein